MENPTSYILKIYRGNPGKQYWEEFELPYDPADNVISGLLEIQKNPINRQGKKVEPVVWEQGCLEEVCGSCSMLINGKPRQSCTALVRHLIKDTGSNVITLAPFTKFPLVRDLIIDRGKMFDNLKKVHAWIEVDGYFDRGPGPKMSQQVQEMRYSLSTCMTCGCCVEACPQINNQSDFIRPADHLPGPAVQFTSHRQNAAHGTVASPHGKGGDKRMRERPKLWKSVS